MGSMKCYIYMLSFLCKSSHFFGHLASSPLEGNGRRISRLYAPPQQRCVDGQWLHKTTRSKSQVRALCRDAWENNIARRNMSAHRKVWGKVNVPHTWTDKLNACFESKPVSGRKCFGFCICVCRCASHVSSGYEPQFVFKLRFRFIERKMFM